MKLSKLNHVQIGFTLIELLIVVVILAILSAVSMPIYREHVLKAQFQELLTYAARYKDEAELEYFMNDTMLHDITETVNSEYVRKVTYWSNNKKDEYTQSIHIYPQNFYQGWNKDHAMIYKGVLNSSKQGMAWQCCQHNGFRALPADIVPNFCHKKC